MCAVYVRTYTMYAAYDDGLTHGYCTQVRQVYVCRVPRVRVLWIKEPSHTHHSTRNLPSPSLQSQRIACQA